MLAHALEKSFFFNLVMFSLKFLRTEEEELLLRTHSFLNGGLHLSDFFYLFLFISVMVLAFAN